MVKHTTRSYHRVSQENRVAIITLSEQGLSQRAIGRQCKVAQKTANNIIRKQRIHDSINDLPRSGRPQKLDDRMKRFLSRMVRKGEIASATELARAALTHHDIVISQWTARRVLHSQGLVVRRTIRKPLLTAVHKKKRLEFARAHSHWNVKDWKQVIFSDEAMITAYPYNTRHYKWTKITIGLNPSLIIPTLQGGGSKIMTWGASRVLGSMTWFCWKRKSMQVITLPSWMSTC